MTQVLAEGPFVIGGGISTILSPLTIWTPLMLSPKLSCLVFREMEIVTHEFCFMLLLVKN